MSPASTSKRKSRPTGPRTLKPSREARRHGALILEALAGVRTTQEAADSMGIALTRYYVLETRALEGFLAALEPRKRGRQVTATRELEKQREEIERLSREVRRYQSLYRSAQRSLGVGATPKAGSTDKAKKPKRRRRKSRAEVVLGQLAPAEGEEES